MSITPAELAQLAIDSGLLIENNDFDCLDDLPCSNCLLNSPDSNSCRFWSATPGFINLATRRKAIAYIHSHHPEFFL